jgi:hypothetical protein
VLEYEVVRRRGHRPVLHIGKHSTPQDAAIAAAVAQAKQSLLRQNNRSLMAGWHEFA